MSTKNSTHHYILLIVFLIPAACKADGLIPLVNFFTKDTIIPASVALTAIILIEAGLLKWIFKDIAFITHLWKSAIINVVSSAAGSFIPQIIAHGPLFYFEYLHYIIPLFGITLVVETVALYFLYSHQLSWVRSAWTSLRLNIISYITVLILTWPLFIAFFFSSYAFESVRAKVWHHKDILNDERGYIYATADVYPKNYLKRYNVSTKMWQEFPKINIDPISYDISGNIFACIVSPDGIARDSAVSVFTLPDLKLIKTYPESYRFRLNQDGTRIALLKRVKGIEYLEGSSYSSDGGLCSLSIRNLEGNDTSNTLVQLVTSEGVDWSPDGEQIAYVSLTDSVLARNANTYSTVSSELVLSTDSAKIKKIMMYNLKKKSVKVIDTGTYPRWSHVGNKIYYIKKGWLYVNDLTNNVQKRLLKMPETTEYYLSPSDNNLVVMVRTKIPLSYTSQLTVINIKTNRRYVLDDRAVYECGWSY